MKGLHFKLVRTWLALLRKVQHGEQASPEALSTLSALAAPKGSASPASATLANAEESKTEDHLANLELVHKHASFFLSLIYKSAALYTDRVKKDLRGPRLDRFSSEYMQELRALILSLAMVSYSRLNLHVAYFLRDNLYLMERNFAVQLASEYVILLDPQYASEKHVAFKFVVLEVLSDFEHYVPLNQPLVHSIWQSTKTPSISNLELEFWNAHPLVGLFLHEVRRCLRSSTATIRHIASRALFAVLWRHEHDSRFQEAGCQAAIANMYFPFLLTVMEFWKMHEHSIDHEELKWWYVCALYILRHCSKGHLLKQWWLGESPPARMDFIELLLNILHSVQEDNLVTEASFVVHALLEDFMDDLATALLSAEGTMLRKCAEVLDALFEKNQTATFLKHGMQGLRWVMHRFRKAVFTYQDTSHCGILSYHILRWCNCPNGEIRTDAAALFASLLIVNYQSRSNIARMKLQSTIAISRLAEADTSSYDALRESLNEVGKALADLAGEKRGVAPLFEKLHSTLKSVIRDSERIAEYRFDPEMTEDLYFDVSLAYVDSPDLRVTWLENLAKHHTVQKNYDEAAQCRVFMAALVIEFLAENEQYKERGLPLTSDELVTVSPDVGGQPGLPKVTALQAAEEGIYQSDLFSEAGLIRTLKEAVRLFACGGSFELGVVLNELSFVQHYCHIRHYQNLSNTFRQMETMAKQLAMSFDARFFGYFYRVLFVGEGWGELHGKEYVYKEQNHVSFVNIMKERLEKQFAAKYDLSKIKLLPNSIQLHTQDLIEKEYESGRLERDMMYWQMVSVKEYLSDAEAKVLLLTCYEMT